MTAARRYVESITPQDQHRYEGWFWDFDTYSYYRWNDLMSLYEHNYFNTELSSMREREIK